MASVSGGDKITLHIQKLVAATTGNPQVSVGFLRGATYPDGTSVALVAATNEFGAPSRNQPPRPFFRQMVAAKKADWPRAVADNLKATDYDGDKTMERMGQGIKGQLQQSIKDLTSPPLAPATIKAKGFDKPLIDSSHMINSADYRVEKDGDGI